MKAIKEDADVVHLVSWNDYSETTEIAPSSGSQFLFYDLTAYYIQWYKTRTPPRIKEDAIYYSHRPQIIDLRPPSMPGMKMFHLLGSTPLQNDIEMIAMLKAPATLEIRLGDQVTKSEAMEGLQILKMPASVGRPRFRILRDGKVELEKSSDWEIKAGPQTLTADYFGGSSNRKFQALP
jgi:hypothetical protein